MSFKAIDNSFSRLAIVARTRTGGDIVYVARSPLSLARCVDVIRLFRANVSRLSTAED
jgi:hypothetical protein